MSEEALKQEEMIEEGGEIVDLEESVEKTEEPVAAAPETEVIEETAVMLQVAFVVELIYLLSFANAP